jgi:hypothetical protein
MDKWCYHIYKTNTVMSRFTITFNRDASHPDMEKDLQFALQAQMLSAQRQQANAASDAAAASLWQAWSSNRPKNCTSIPIGNFFQTNCY